MSDLFKSGRLSGNARAEEKKIEHALVLVAAKGGTYLLHGVGVAIESDLDAGLGREEAGPVSSAPKEPGIWVWEGTPTWSYPYNGEGINEGSEPYYDKGVWRRMNKTEEMRFLLGALEEMWGPSQWPPPAETPDDETRCHAASDGECVWEKCPQLKDGEPKKTGRHCPLDKDVEEF